MLLFCCSNARVAFVFIGIQDVNHYYKIKVRIRKNKCRFLLIVTLVWYALVRVSNIACQSSISILSIFLTTASPWIVAGLRTLVPGRILTRFLMLALGFITAGAKKWRLRGTCNLTSTTNCKSRFEALHYGENAFIRK